jgi:hypothetical protein
MSKDLFQFFEQTLKTILNEDKNYELFYDQKFQYELSPSDYQQVHCRHTFFDESKFYKTDFLENQRQQIHNLLQNVLSELIKGALNFVTKDKRKSLVISSDMDKTIQILKKYIYHYLAEKMDLFSNLAPQEPFLKFKEKEGLLFILTDHETKILIHQNQLQSQSQISENTTLCNIPVKSFRLKDQRFLILVFEPLFDLKHINFHIENGMNPIGENIMHISLKVPNLPLSISPTYVPLTSRDQSLFDTLEKIKQIKS